jgi:hypothetical protein
MRYRATSALFLAAGIAIGMIAPATAVAAPSPDSCAAETSAAHTMAVPAGMRTAGVHRFERRFTHILTDGSTADGGTAASEITIDAAAPTYRNVQLRVVRNDGSLADGTIVRGIGAMRPDQVAAFYSQVSWAKSEPVVTVLEELRYEIRRNQWTGWIEVPNGPSHSLCVEARDSIILKSFGWAG